MLSLDIEEAAGVLHLFAHSKIGQDRKKSDHRIGFIFACNYKAKCEQGRSIFAYKVFLGQNLYLLYTLLGNLI